MRAQLEHLSACNHFKSQWARATNKAEPPVGVLEPCDDELANLPNRDQLTCCASGSVRAHHLKLMKCERKPTAARNTMRRLALIILRKLGLAVGVLRGLQSQRPIWRRRRTNSTLLVSTCLSPVDSH